MVPLPPPSPTSSSVSSSDLDTESTGSFFHDRSTTLGTLMGVTFPAAQSAPAAMDLSFNNSRKQRRVMRIKKKFHKATAVAERRRKWWSLCSDAEARPASLGEFLEVERRYGDAAFFDGEDAAAAAVCEGGNRGRPLFADGRVLPPGEVVVVGGGSSSAVARGTMSRFPVMLTGICSGGVG